jgi:hypothetical protein
MTTEVLEKCIYFYKELGKAILKRREKSINWYLDNQNGTKESFEDLQEKAEEYADELLIKHLDNLIKDNLDYIFLDY